MNRRSFLKTAAASAPLIMSAGAFGANEEVKIGLIGLGGRCRWLMKEFGPVQGARIVAACDCFKPRLDSFMAMEGKDKGWNGYLDFREMIEKEKLDAVMVETTTHARAWIACHCMAMGVDTYIEKPMCLTIAEGRHMVNCARKYKTVTQVGTQQRSIPLNNWASDLVQNGAIGKLIEVQAPNFVGPLMWTPPEPPADGSVDPNTVMPEGSNDGWWDIWTNQAVMRPYHKALHTGWDTWWDYDGGGRCFGVTGWGTHSYDQLQRGLGTSETGPVEVTLEEPVSDKPAGYNYRETPMPSETGAGYYHMCESVVGPRARVSMRYKNGVKANLCMDADYSPGLGAIFIGEKGRIEINRDKISASDDSLISGSDRPEHLAVPETAPHIQNWVDCIKSRERCNADIEYGQRSSTICYLSNIVREVGLVGKPLKWDPDKEVFTNCDDANKLLSRPRREGWELPM